MKIIGYFEGTNPEVLTRLVAEGYHTRPIANPWDGHGKICSQLAPGDVDLIIGYLHKFMSPVGTTKTEAGIPELRTIDPPKDISPFDLLYPAKANNIPVLVIIPDDCHKEAKNLLGEAAKFVNFVSPDKLEISAMELLQK